MKTPSKKRGGVRLAEPVPIPGAGSGTIASDGGSKSLADSRRRSDLLHLAEDHDRLNKIVLEVAERNGKTFDEAFGGVMAVIEAVRERDALDESTCDPERLAIADRVDARVLSEQITLAEAIEREGVE